LKQPVDQRLSAGAVDLRLGKRQYVEDVDPAGQRLPGLRQGRIASGTGENEPPRPQIAVELGFDRVEQFGHVLVFVDQHRLGPLDEPPGIVPDGCACRGIVAIDHRLAQTLR
jgi:hypothetical protein